MSIRMNENNRCENKFCNERATYKVVFGSKTIAMLCSQHANDLETILQRGVPKTKKKRVLVK